MTVVFGGTFDPVHNGHMHAARMAAQACDSQVTMVLSARPGHRTPPSASIADRWAMLAAACADDPALAPSDIEVRRPGPSYAVDTLRALGATRADPVIWVIGADAIASIDDWHQHDTLAELCSFLVLDRPGPEGANVSSPAGFEPVSCPAGLREVSGSVFVLRQAMLDVSATAIRADLAAGRDVSGLLPVGVWTYIRQRGLYRN